MSIENIRQIIRDIDPGLWEQSLNIGKFKSVDVLNLLDRTHSEVARCRVTGHKNAANIYVKYYKTNVTTIHNKKEEEIRQQLLADYKTTEFWFDKFKNNNLYSVVEPLFYLPEKLILATRESEGQILYNILPEGIKYWGGQKKVEFFCKTFEMVGGWLKQLHSFETDTKNTFDIEKHKEYLKIRLESLAEDPRRKFPTVLSNKIINYIDESKDNINGSDLQIRYSHNDFNLSNILVAKNKIIVLDFGEIFKNSFVMDISRLYHQLWLFGLKPGFSQTSISKFQNSMIKGYDQPDLPGREIFKIFMIRHIITHLVTITRFWLQTFPEQVYNKYVMKAELKYLGKLIKV